MKSQLTTPGIVGRPLNLTQIEAIKCEILLILRALPSHEVNSEIVRRVICGSDLNKMVEFAVALTRLEEQNEIIIATLGTQMFIKLASTVDEAQGSTSRTVAGEKVICGGVEGHAPTGLKAGVTTDCPRLCNTADNRVRPSEYQSSPAGNSDFSILHRPHIVRPKEEVHVELCHECERMATGHCECGNAVCLAHRYDSEGTHAPDGMCGDCHDTPQDRTEVYGSNGRQV